MKKELLKEIIKKKENKIEFAIITNLENGESCVFEKNKAIDKNFEKHIEKINFHFDKRKMVLSKEQVYLLKLIFVQSKLLLLEQFI